MSVTLRSTEGIDSVHIDIKINSRDLKRFCNDQKLKLEEKEKKFDWQREWFIFLAGEAITVTYNTRHKNCRFEFGGLLNYNSNPYKLQLLPKLLYCFSDRSCLVSRLDYAVDFNRQWDEFLPDMKGNYSIECVDSSIYFNRFNGAKNRKKLSTLIVYDKARQLDLFSTPLTRIELRLFRPQLKRLGLTTILHSMESFMKMANHIYSVFEHCLKLHNVYGEWTFRIKTDAIKTLQVFIEFLHGNGCLFTQPDPFQVRKSLMISNKLREWMKSECIQPAEVKKHIKGKKGAVCKSLGVDPKTFDKAITFFESA